MDQAVFDEVSNIMSQPPSHDEAMPHTHFDLDRVLKELPAELHSGLFVDSTSVPLQNSSHLSAVASFVRPYAATINSQLTAQADLIPHVPDHIDIDWNSPDPEPSRGTLRSETERLCDDESGKGRESRESCGQRQTNTIGRTIEQLTTATARCASFARTLEGPAEIESDFGRKRAGGNAR